jgi:putative hemolysin
MQAVQSDAPAGLCEPIAEAESKAALAWEVQALGRARTLYSSGDYSVLVAERESIPSVMNEIGRLRELSFRAAGEGTGRSRDLDSFDDWYMQLFVWQASRQQILGAYRLCMTDVVRRRHGDAGLYTNSLFAFEPGFLDELGSALELGRSFVRPELQGAGRVLALLWRGIGHLLAARPRYRRLFGPVSVSADYTDASRQLIASRLCSGSHRHALATRVRALHPIQLAVERLERPGEQDVRELSRRVSELEPDQKGLPILVKEYVKLGGQFLAFSVDPDFQAAMDGLVVVDLGRTSPRLLSLHMGPENYERFANYPGVLETPRELGLSPG